MSGGKSEAQRSMGLEIENSESGALVVAAVKVGSPAHFSFQLANGDELLEVNDTACTSIRHAASLIAGVREALVRIKVRRPGDGGVSTVALLRQCAFEQQLPEDNAAQRAGIGAILSTNGPNSSPRVLRVLPGSTAGQREEFLLDDVVTLVDGKDVTGMPLPGVAALLQGPAFSRVEVGLVRKNAPLQLHLVRAPKVEGVLKRRLERYERELLRAQSFEKTELGDDIIREEEEGSDFEGGDQGWSGFQQGQDGRVGGSDAHWDGASTDRRSKQAAQCEDGHVLLEAADEGRAAAEARAEEEHGNASPLSASNLGSNISTDIQTLIAEVDSLQSSLARRRDTTTERIQSMQGKATQIEQELLRIETACGPQ